MAPISEGPEEIKWDKTCSWEHITGTIFVTMVMR